MLNSPADRCPADELLVCLMARAIAPGDIVMQGIATPLALIAFLLARLHHAPGVQAMHTSGCTLSQQAGPVRLCGLEELTVRQCLSPLSGLRLHGDFGGSLRPKEFLRPAQVDGAGRTNNVAIGRPGETMVRLPGSGGIADITTFNPNLYLYVPRHDPRVLVDRVDLVSGAGHLIRTLFTDLCVFRFADGHAVLESLHPGVELALVKARTGFDFAVPAVVPRTPPPDPEEQRLLRTEVDPLGLRRLEFVDGRQRQALLRHLVAAEKSYFDIR